MAYQLKKFNLNAEELGSVEVSAALAEAKANEQQIKDYIVALRENARQWSASTKTRAEVSHTTKKPHKQKGGGRARQGSLVAPQYRGGGRVFTPRPKFDQHVRINQKEKRSAIKALLAMKIQNGNMLLLDSTQMEEPQTKKVAAFLKKCTEGKSVLFLGEANYAEEVSVKTEQHDQFKLSLRNLQKVRFNLVKNVSGYDVIAHNDIVITEKGLEELENWLVKGA